MSLQTVFDQYVLVVKELGGSFDFYATAPAIEQSLTMYGVKMNSAQFVNKIFDELGKKHPATWLKPDKTHIFLESLPKEWKAKVPDDVIKTKVKESDWLDFRDASWIKKNQHSLVRTHATTTWNDEEISVYIGVHLEGEMAPGVKLENLTWEFVSAFPLSKIIVTGGDSSSKEEWLEWLAYEQENDDWFVQLEKDWDPESQPIILIKDKNGNGVLNDGHHRVAIAYKRGMNTIPAMVGKEFRKAAATIGSPGWMEDPRTSVTIGSGKVIPLPTKEQKLIKDLTQGTRRYPRAKRKLSEEDIERLDQIFFQLNRMGRGQEYDDLENEAHDLLGWSESTGLSFPPQTLPGSPQDIHHIKGDADNFKEGWEKIDESQQIKNFGGDLWCAIVAEDGPKYGWVMTFGDGGPILDGWSGQADTWDGAMGEADEAAQNIMTKYGV